MSAKKLSVVFFLLFHFVMYSQNNINKVVLYAIPFNSLIEYDLDIEAVEKFYMPNQKKSGIFDTTINDQDILLKFEKEIKSLKECDRAVNVRIICYIYYSNGETKSLAFGYDQQIIYDGKNYARSPKLFKTVKNILPRKLRKHVGLVRRIRHC